MERKLQSIDRPLGSGAFGGGTYIVAASITDVLMRMQAHLGISGDFAEIGVLEGVYIHQLYSYLTKDEVCIAIDPYSEYPELKNRVEADFNTRYGTGNRVKFLFESSLGVSQKMLVKAGSPGIRFFSIDGNHSEKYVLNDLTLAAKTLVKGGIVAIDDYFDPYSPGVSIGMTRYFLERNEGRLVVLISGGNKVFLTTKNEYLVYRLLFEKFTDIENSKTNQNVEWFGSSVFVTENILRDNLPH